MNQVIIIPEAEFKKLESLGRVKIVHVSEKWISSKEAEKYLGVSRPTLIKLKNTGSLTYRERGRKVEYLRESLEDYLESKAYRVKPRAI